MNAARPQLTRLSGFFTILLLLLAGPAVALAQDATPSGHDSHPVHVHEGTCDELDPQPLFPLTDITAPTGTEKPGTGSPVPVETSTTTIDATLSDLTDGNRAINAHESMENIGNYIACGDIGGTIVSGDTGDIISVGLHELNDSGYSGIAVLEADGDQSTITIYLAQGLSGDATATPVAEMDRSAEDATSDAVQVDMVDLAYSPDTVTISAGESVTWTNNDSVAHSVTAKNRDALQSGTIQPGETFTQTFDTPGTYEYFCEFHANMSGVVVVE